MTSHSHFDEKSSSVEASSERNLEVQRKESRDDILERSRDAVDLKVAKRALRKIDLVILPLFVITYFLAFLDRGNIGNARVAGLQKDLGMSNKQFSIALTITFIPFILTEIPYPLLMKRVGAHVALPFMITLWGMVTACHGAARSYKGLLALRFFLGVAEGGIFPVIVLYMSSIYKRHELQIRISLITASVALAGAFSGLLAAALQQIDARGLPGWAWIFVVEGVITSAFGIVVYFVLPENLEKAWFLSPAEKQAYREDLERDWSGDLEHEAFSWVQVFKALKSPHVWFICIPLFMNGATLYGLAIFVPTIVSALGNTPTHTQLLSVPPFACAWVAAIGASYFADRYRQRGITIIIANLIASAGYIIFLATPAKHANYAAVCLQVMGIYMNPPCLASWVANNVQPHYRRATAIGIAFIFTNSGGILSTWIFNDPPRFAFATRLNLAFALGTAITSGMLAAYFIVRNREKERILAEGNVDASMGARVTLGDAHPYFKYTT